MKKMTAVLIVLFFLPFTSFAAEKYIDNGDGTITDTSTTLMWMKLYSDNQKKRTFLDTQQEKAAR